MITLHAKSAFVSYLLRFPKDFPVNEGTYTNTSVLTIGLSVLTIGLLFFCF